MQLNMASRSKFEQSQASGYQSGLAQMGANWRRWHLNEIGLEMELSMATGNKFEQSKAIVVPIGLSADGSELAQMAFK